MSCMIHKTGQRFLSDMLAGSPYRINGMYIEYGDAEIGIGTRDLEYFESRDAYIRTGISNAYVDNDLVVHFTATICPGELPIDGATLRCVTLACLKDNNPSNDIMVCTMKLKEPVVASDQAYTVVHTSMKLGAEQ